MIINAVSHSIVQGHPHMQNMNQSENGNEFHHCVALKRKNHCGRLEWNIGILAK